MPTNNAIPLQGCRVVVTGHRDIRGERASLVGEVLLRVLDGLKRRHPEGIVAISGMAVGADIEFAEAALTLGIPLVAALPVETQAHPWPQEAQARYWRAVARANLVVSVWKEHGYSASSIGAQMFARDRWMLDHSDEPGSILIAVWDGREAGGTWATLKEARKRGRRILILDPRSGKLTVDTSVRLREHAKPSGFGVVYPIEVGTVDDRISDTVKRKYAEALAGISGSGGTVFDVGLDDPDPSE